MKIDKINPGIVPTKKTKDSKKTTNNSMKVVIEDEYIKENGKNVKIRFNVGEFINFIKKTLFNKDKEEDVILEIEDKREKSSENTLNNDFNSEQKNPREEMTSQKALETLKNGADDSKLIKAVEYITAHGISDIEEINTTYFANGSDDVIISLVKFYEKWGSKDQADYLMIPITSKKYTSLTDRSELYKEILKAVQKLADLSDYTEQERKEIFYNPIRNLLNHNDKNIRILAQETLNKITPNV